MARHNNDTVTLPAAAENAAEHLEDKFKFSDTNAHVPPQQVEPLEHVPPQAADYVPDDIPIPPEGLPSQASNMSDTAMSQLEEHLDWLIS